jgi:manganese transport protein
MDSEHNPAGEAERSPAAVAAGSAGMEGAGNRSPRLPPFRRNQMWSYFGPAFVASVAYIDPGNFATNIVGGSQFGYRLLWVLLWSNAMAIVIQYLSAKLGIVTGKTLPQSCRDNFSRPWTIALWIAAEISAVATDLAEFLGAALGIDLLLSPALHARGWTPVESLLFAAAIATVAVFGILALDLAGYQWLERGIMLFVAAIGLCYGFEVFLVHPDWMRAALGTLIPTFDRSSHAAFSGSVTIAVGMLGATVMPHVIYLHSALVQPRREEMAPPPPKRLLPAMIREYLHYELIDVFVAMNGAWLINSAMIIMAAVALARGVTESPSIQDAYRTLGPLLGTAAAIVFAVALICSGLSSATVGVMAGQVIIEGFLHIQFPIFLRRFITVVPALIVIAVGLDPLRILVASQVLLSFTLPAALIPLLILTARKNVMGSFVSAMRTQVTGWVIAGIILALNGVLIWQLATG